MSTTTQLVTPDINQVDKVVEAFFDMREECPHYYGIKRDLSDVQCDHADNRHGDWCGMDCCPVLHAHAREHGVGWD